MKILNRITQLLIVFATTISLFAPTFADEDKKLTQLYSQFNAELINLGFAEASLLFDEEKIYGAMRILKNANMGLLWSFYSKQHAASDQECHSHSYCRESGLIFLSVLAFTEYEIVSIGKTNGASKKMGVSGRNGTTKNKAIVRWLLEDGEWKIDSITMVPTNWNIEFD